MCAYLGLNIVMGASPRHQYEDYWKDDDFSGLCSIQICDVAEQVSETYLVFTSQICGLQTKQGPPLSTIPSKRVMPLYDISRSNFKEYYI